MGFIDWILRRQFVQKAVSMEAYKVLENFKFPPYNSGRKYHEEQFAPERKYDYLQTYEKHIWIYSTVYAIASSLAQLPIRVYALDSKGNKGEEVKDGPVWQLVNRPNPNETRYDFIEALSSYMELTGDGFVEKNHPTMPTQLYVLRSDYMRINSSPDKLVVNYEYIPEGVRSTTFKPEEVIHFKFFHPRSEVYGFSFVQAARTSLVLDYDAIKFQKNFFKQGAAVDKYITVKKELSPTEFARFKDEVRTEYSGVDKAHLPMVLDNDGEMKSVGVTMDKVMLGEQRALNRDEIFSGSGVPPIMANLLAGKETYNNASTQEKAFWQNTIKPKATKLQDKLNVELFNKMRFMCEFDFSGIQALQEDKQVKANTARTKADGGIFTVNEIRETDYNAKPIAGGDVLRQPQPAGFGGIPGSAASIQQTPAQNAPAQASAGVPEAAPAVPLSQVTLNGAQIQAAMSVVQALARNEIGPIAAEALLTSLGMSRKEALRVTSEKVVASPTPVSKAARIKAVDPEKVITFGQMFETSKAMLKNLESAVLKSIGTIKKADYTSVEDVIASLDKETLSMVKDLSEIENKTFDQLVKANYSQLTGKQITPETLNSIREKTAGRINKWAKISGDSIVKTAKERVTNYLTGAYKSNASLKDITKGIQEIFEGTEREQFPWARGIARTETLKMQSTSAMESMKAGGFDKKTWIAGGPPGDRPEHTEMDGVTIPIDEPFVLSNGEKMMYPGDPDADVSELVNCRCGITEGV